MNNEVATSENQYNEPEKQSAAAELLTAIDFLIQQSQWGDALLLCDNVLKQSPRSAETLYRRGHIRYHLGDKVGAADDLRTALAIKPELNDKITARLASVM